MFKFRFRFRKSYTRKQILLRAIQGSVFDKTYLYLIKHLTVKIIESVSFVTKISKIKL